MNAERPIDDSWLDWIKTNLARNCEPNGIKQILIDKGFSTGAIKVAMGASYPRDPNEVDYERLQGVPLTRSSSDAVRRESDQIQLYTLSGFLSPADCAQLVDLVKGNLRPSTVTLDSTDKMFRTSSTCHLAGIDHPLIKSVDRKIAEAMGINPSYAERMQAQSYVPGQQFKPHTDFFEPRTEEYVKHCTSSGNRTWTFMIYLTEVSEGGGTTFTKIGKTIVPKTGMAVMWNNLTRDGSPDRMTLHSGDPVIQGEKVIITKWFRERGAGPMFP